MKRALFVMLLVLSAISAPVRGQSRPDRTDPQEGPWFGFRAGLFLPTTDLYQGVDVVSWRDRLRAAPLLAITGGAPLANGWALRLDLAGTNPGGLSDFSAGGTTSVEHWQGGQNWMLAGIVSVIATPRARFFGARPYGLVGLGLKYYHLGGNITRGGDLKGPYAAGLSSGSLALGGGLRLPLGSWRLAVEGSDLLSRFEKRPSVLGGRARWQNDVTLTGGIEVPFHFGR